MNWLNAETNVFIPDAGSWGFITVTCAEGVWLRCNCAYYKKNTVDTNTHSAQALVHWLQNPLDRQVCARFVLSRMSFHHTSSDCNFEQ